MNSPTKWFAIHTRPKCEKRVSEFLAQKNYECMFPTFQKRHAYAYRIVERTLPLFPSYVFCRFDHNIIGKVVTTPGVIRIVGFGKGPAEIPKREIESLQLLASSNLLREPWQHIPNGTMVTVTSGPLTGVEGILCATDDHSNKRNKGLIISVSLLQRSVKIQLDDDVMLSVIRGPKKDRKKERGEIVSNDNLNIALKLLK